jgi:hypothetical protein
MYLYVIIEQILNGPRPKRDRTRLPNDTPRPRSLAPAGANNTAQADNQGGAY